MTAWTDVEVESFDRLERTKRAGVKIEISLSPYDIPEAVKGCFCPDHNKFVISFRYLSKEGLTEKIINENLTVCEGIESGRVYEIYIDVHAINAETVSLEVKPILDEFYESISKKLSSSSDLVTSGSSRISSAGVTGEIIERYQNEIFR